MVTKVYAHILDEDRKTNAQKFERAFYAELANPDLRNSKPPQSNNAEIEVLIDKLRSATPEQMAMLAQLLGK